MIRSRLANALAALLALAVVAATATATSSPASAATSSHHTMTVMHHTVANPPAINAHRATKTLGTHDLFSSAALSRSPKHADPATPLRPRDIAVLLLVVCPAQAPRGPPPGYELASGTTDAGGDPVNETDPLGLGDWLCDVLGDFDSSCLASNPPPLVRCTEAGYGTANCLNMELNPAYPVVAAGGTAYLESQEPCTSNWAIAGNSLLAAGIVATDAVGGEDADDIWSVDSLSSSGAELNPAAEGEGLLNLSAEDSWGNPSSLEDHFLRHGADFGATSADQYANDASQFLQQALKDGYPVKVDADGVIRVYDPETNTFGAYNANGTTRTFFKPTNGAAYWASQPGSTP